MGTIQLNFVLITTILILNSSALKSAKLQRGTYQTRVDHFSVQNINKVTFYYESNMEFYQTSGPLFIYLPEAGQYTTRWIEEGLMFDVARELNAALLTTDYRYMGDNIPTDTASFSDLTYNTAEQTVTDIAYLIDTLKTGFSLGTRVILFGSGYGAKIATWVRQRYPHVVQGVLASSGIFAPEPISYSYYKTLERIFRDIDPVCANRIDEIFDSLDNAFNNDPELLQIEFNLCVPLAPNSNLDKTLFFEVQLDRMTEFIHNNHLNGIFEICRLINAIPDDPLRSFSRWIRFYFRTDLSCQPDYAQTFEILRNEYWGQPGTVSGGRQLFHGTCTQVGYMRVTDIDSIFGHFITPESFNYRCEQIFGPGYWFYALNEATRGLRIQFGGNGSDATHVIFTNGMLDPWVDHGILETNQPHESFVYNFQFSSRSADLESLLPWDFDDVREAKENIREKISEWVRPDPR